MRKKVTLSLDDKVYEKFKKFCEDNAIRLSKYVELCMIEKMKEQDQGFANPIKMKKGVKK